MWFLGSHRSHGFHRFSFDGEKSHGGSTDCGFLGSHGSHGFHRFSFDGEKSHGGWWCGVGVLSDYSECSECSDLSKLTQIQRDSTKRLFVGICANLWQKKTIIF